MLVYANIIVLAAFFILIVIEEVRYRRFRAHVFATKKALSVLACKLRSPLVSMHGLLGLLRSDSLGPLTKEQKKVLDEMGGEKTEMMDILNHFLSVSRIEESMMNDEETQTNLEDCIAAVITGLSDRAAERNITVTLESETNAIMVRGNPASVHGMVDSVLCNACCYTEEGGSVQVVLSEEKTHAVLEIVDDGVGISKGEEEKLFDMFFRGKNACKMCDGCGLGLSCAKELASSMGGSITFDRNEQKGLTFRIELPLA